MVWIVAAVILLIGLGAGGAAMATRGALPAGFAAAGGRVRRLGGHDRQAAPGAVGVAPDAFVGAPGAVVAEAVDLPAVATRRLRPAGAFNEGPTLPPIATSSTMPPAILSAAALESIERRLARLDERLEAFERSRQDETAGLRRAVAETTAAIDATRAALASELAALAAREEGALERLRSDLAAATGGPVHGREASPARALERRADCAADLYGRVARLESSLAQVTNPVLLPGEPYAPPVEFLPEALAWENWKDVGERAFALADGYSAQRVLLSGPARVEVAAFVTTLRGVLTREVYPNLAVDAAAPQMEALRAALATLAAQLPAVRHALEAEYRMASGQDAANDADDPSFGQ